jgi:hypothetical protein
LENGGVGFGDTFGAITEGRPSSETGIASRTTCIPNLELYPSAKGPWPTA